MKNKIKICVGIMLINILMLINSVALAENMAIIGEKSIESTITPTINPTIAQTKEYTIISETTEKEQPNIVETEVETEEQTTPEKTTEESPGFEFIISIPILIILILIFRNKRG